MRRVVSFISLTLCGGLTAHAANPFSDIMKGVKSQLSGNPVIIGTVEVQSPFPGIVTCFEGTPGSAISRGPIKSLTEAEGYPAIIMTKSGEVVSGKCSVLQEKGLLKGAAGKAGTAGAPGVVTIQQTELAGIFEKYPQPGGGKWTDWPRVAITLVDAPPWGKDKQNLHQFKFPSYGCWSFRAKVWESAKQSRDLPQFKYCTDQSLTKHGGDVEVNYQVWSGIVGGSSMMNLRNSTGITRTEGPNWPDTPLPVATRAGDRFVNLATFNGMLLYMVMYDTGMDFRLEDHRLWLNVPDALLNQ
jgi:hypothetical protein